MRTHELNEPLIGLAKLIRMAYSGCDLAPLGTQLVERAKTDTSGHALIDLSTVLQLRGNYELAMAMQAQAIGVQQIYSLPTATNEVNIRLLAIMGAGDLMANTPLELLLENSDVALDIVYVTQDLPLPANLPDHDILFVAIAQCDKNMALLHKVGAAIASWTHPVLNRPERIAMMSRDQAYALLKGAPGVDMPITVRVPRQILQQVIDVKLPLTDILIARDGVYAASQSGTGAAIARDGVYAASLPRTDEEEGASFPIIVRPVDSHAGKGLEKVENIAGLASYLQNVSGDEFYVSHFVDYRGQDGLFRKYRIALIDGKPFICHVGVSDHWMIHYLNAGMAESADKRAEEAHFMIDFDSHFACKHAEAFHAINERVGLDYLGIDCSETPDGKLLIFEVDNCMIVHAIDSVDIFPYKQPQMSKVFSAFRQMLFSAMQRGVL